MIDSEKLKYCSINYCKQLRKKYRKFKNDDGMRERLNLLKVVIEAKQKAYFEHFQRVPGFKWEGNRKQYAK